MNVCRIALVVVLFVAAGNGCKSKSSREAKLPDLSTSLDAVRSEFNAHKEEARFLALLAPT